MRYTGKIRFVDRYIGSIILFLFTLLHKFRLKPRDRKIKNILIIELVEMGASVMGYASIAYIKKLIPDARIFVLCTENTKEPWMLLDGIDPQDVIALDNTSTAALLRSIAKQTLYLSKKKIDLIIDFELFTRISAILSLLIKTKLRAGFFGYTMGGLYRGNILDIKCNFNQNMHISKNLLALTKSALDPDPKYYNWEGPIPNSEIVTPLYRSDASIKAEIKKKVDDAVSAKTEHFILLAPTVGQMLPMRDYPKERYVTVIKRLLELYPQHHILLVGTRAHSAVGDLIQNAVGHKRCVNFCGKTATLRELLELFSIADLLITNDSGNPHFAAMVGLKTVALYGPETPFMYGPLGNAICLFEFFHSSPSITTYNHKNPPSDSNASVVAISTDKVINSAQLVMEGKAMYLTIDNKIPYLL